MVYLFMITNYIGGERLKSDNLGILSLAELKEVAKEMGLKNIGKYKKADLVEAIRGESNPESPRAESFEDIDETGGESLPGINAEIDDNLFDDWEKKYGEKDVSDNRSSEQSEDKDLSDDKREDIIVEGVLEVQEEYGFLRFKNYLPSDSDVYVPKNLIKRFNLRTGDKVKGKVRRPRNGENLKSLIYIDTVNGDRARSQYRVRFENLTPLYPSERFHLSMDNNDPSLRIIDLIAPIGKGQRGLIVAPPKAGKTVLLQKIAKGIRKNNPEVELIVLLIDERPEEVTDMIRSIDADVVYSTFDELPSHHIKVAEMVLARAKSLVEHKKDVVVLLDSITRLARSYNLVVPPSGKTLTGGFDPAALHKPKRFFGAARNVEEGGSLTIIATALVETGSRMDEVIYEEFKGTGNMELALNRKLQEKRIFPAIDIRKSGTRKEELLMDQSELEAVWNMRKALGQNLREDMAESIIDKVLNSKNNEEFIQLIRKINF
jgi:transcription termination factor Rho